MNPFPFSMRLYGWFLGLHKSKQKGPLGYFLNYSLRHYAAAIILQLLLSIFLFAIIKYCGTTNPCTTTPFFMLPLLVNIFLNGFTPEIKNYIEEGHRKCRERFKKAQKNAENIEKYRLSIMPFILYYLSWIFNLLFSPFWMVMGRPSSDIWTIMRLAVVIIVFIFYPSFPYNICWFIIIYLLFELISYNLRLIFTADTNQRYPIQDAARSIFLFLLSYLFVIFAFAYSYASYVTHKSLALVYSIYHMVPMNLLETIFGDKKNIEALKMIPWWIPTLETAIGTFLLLIILTQFLETLSKSKDE